MSLFKISPPTHPHLLNVLYKLPRVAVWHRAGVFLLYHLLAFCFVQESNLPTCKRKYQRKEEVKKGGLFVMLIWLYSTQLEQLICTKEYNICQFDGFVSLCTACWGLHAKRSEVKTEFEGRRSLRDEIDVLKTWHPFCFLILKTEKCLKIWSITTALQGP